MARELINHEFAALYDEPTIQKFVIAGEIRWAGYVARTLGIYPVNLVFAFDPVGKEAEKCREHNGRSHYEYESNRANIMLIGSFVRELYCINGHSNSFSLLEIFSPSPKNYEITKEAKL